MISPQMVGGGRGRVGGGFLMGFTKGNFAKTYPTSTPIRNPNLVKPWKSIEIYANHLFDRKITLRHPKEG